MFGRSFEENLFRPPDSISPQRGNSSLLLATTAFSSNSSLLNGSAIGTPSFNSSQTDFLAVPNPPSVAPSHSLLSQSLGSKRVSEVMVNNAKPPSGSALPNVESNSTSVSESAGTSAKEKKKKSKPEITSDANGGKGGGNSVQGEGPRQSKRPNMKEMTRAERRELQVHTRYVNELSLLSIIEA